MESFNNFIKKALLFIGFDMDGKFRSNKYKIFALNVYKYFIFIMIGLSSFQNFAYAYSNGIKKFEDFRAIVSGMFSLRCFLMSCFLLMNIEKIHSLIASINELDLILKKFDCNYDLFSKAKRFSVPLFINNVLAMWFYSLGGIIETTKSLFTGEKPQKFFTVLMYWPFDPNNYLPWTLYWVAIGMHYWQWTACTVNLLVIYVTVYLIVCTRNFYNFIGDTINNCDSRSNEETNENLKNCIKIHNKIIECFNSTRSLFGFPLIVFIGEGSIMLCCVGYSLLVSFF